VVAFAEAEAEEDQEGIMRRWRDVVARTIVVVIVRKLMIAWKPLAKPAPRAWAIADDDAAFASILSLTAWVFEPKESDRVCMTCLDRRIREMPSKHEQGIHGRYATNGPPTRDLAHWRAS
jgi:hypothetical protein